MDIRKLRLVPIAAAVLVAFACDNQQQNDPLLGEPSADVQGAGEDIGAGAENMGQDIQEGLGMQPEGEMAAAGEQIPVDQIMQSPTEWTGRTIDGQAQVTEVVSDRGFWVESNGQRLFVLLDEQQAAGQQPANLQAGSTIRMSQATVRDPNYLTGMTDLDPQLQTAASGQEVFLTVDAANIQQAG